jgi:diguanylate cyclase (GGDEF)-like protein
LAIAFCLFGFSLYPFEAHQRAQLHVMLAVATAYNFGLLWLIRRRFWAVRDGSLPTLCDGLLCAAMVAIVGGFESPFYAILYSIVISAGMRLGFARGMVLAGAIGVIDAAGKVVGGDGILDAAYVVRTGVLFLTAFLTSFLHEEMHKNEAVLAERLQQSEVLNQALEHQALHDLLTDLPNRTMLHHRLDQALARRAPDGSLALLLIDLDRFKEINDTFGHQYGDLLLQQIEPRLRTVLAGGDVVARLGGDEFAVLLTDADAAHAERVARQLLLALDEPFSVAGYTLDIGGSIGISVCPEHASDPDLLLRRADIAMYVAKRSSRGLAVYSPEHDQHSPDRIALVGELRRAIDNDELVLLYQPKVSLQTGRTIGVEALVRWHHPRRGLVAPDQFVPLAEQTGLIRALSRWVLDTALRQARAWRKAGLDVPIAVNLSMRDLHDPELPDIVAMLLAAWQVPSSSLMVEITENGLMADPARALTTVAALRAMGIRIAIDDFGTGYSSLAYLKRLPVDELKIDRSFVRELAANRDDLAIVRSTIGLGHDLRLKIVAEGVEDVETLALLRSLGCDIGQGYHIGRPVTADALFEQLLQTVPAAA